MATFRSLIDMNPPSPLGTLGILPLEVRDKIYSYVLANNDGWWNHIEWSIPHKPEASFCKDDPDTTFSLDRSVPLRRQAGFCKDDLDTRFLLECLPMMQTSTQVRRECLETVMREPEFYDSHGSYLTHLLAKSDGTHLHNLLEDLSKQFDLLEYARTVGIVMDPWSLLGFGHIELSRSFFGDQAVYHAVVQHWITKQINKLRRCFDAFNIPSSRYFLDICYEDPRFTVLTANPTGSRQFLCGLARIRAFKYSCEPKVHVRIWVNDADASIRVLNEALAAMEMHLTRRHRKVLDFLDDTEGHVRRAAVKWVQQFEDWLLVRREKMERLREYHISWIERMEILWDGYYGVGDFFNMVEGTNQS